MSIFKWVGYRLGLGRPDYPYKLDPAQLAFLCEAITATREIGGAVMEIGVAKGDTSVFLLEHLRTTDDPRRIVFLDTFTGFTDEAIDVEVRDRGKVRGDYDTFRYVDEAIFRRNLQRLGYANFETVKGDAAGLDFGQFGPISVALLDIDLYQPTKSVLPLIWERLTTPGFICVDDCRPASPWDGAMQAYEEFIAEHGLAPRIVGRKGGVIVKT